MIRLPLDASDQAILDVVFQWVHLLAQDKYQEAFDLTSHREEWTPELMRQVIENYGSTWPRRDGKKFRVTLPQETSGGRAPTHEVTRPNPNAPSPQVLSGGSLLGSYESLIKAQHQAFPDFLGEVWFDLPLNGEWSDVTATFDLVKSGDNLVLELAGIHVH